MSKSLDNSICSVRHGGRSRVEAQAGLHGPAENPRHRPRPPGRMRGDGLSPEIPPEDADAVEAECRGGRLGCVAHKKSMTAVLNGFLDPFREKRARYEADPGLSTTFSRTATGARARRRRPPWPRSGRRCTWGRFLPRH
ncbi:MAG: hypothetical protein MZV49_00600 [Rhodopseudomonas palustris]|nr:hypothetical protein [Rhodopseudomonas palustris]